MFSESSNGSKIALIALMGILALNRFDLLDVQFMTSHLKSMGAREISRSLFLNLLKTSISSKAKFNLGKTCNVDETLIYHAEKKRY